MFETLKTPRWRRRFWILAGVALGLKIFQTVSGAENGIFVPVNIILVLAALAVVRILWRKFLFKVSRRLVLAFFLVGVTPLFFAVFFGLLMAGAGLLQVMNADIQREVDRVQHEADAIARELAASSTGSPVEFADRDLPPIETLTLSDGAALPAWMAGPSFSGIVARDDRAYLISMRRGEGANAHTVLVSCALDSAFTGYLGERMNIELGPLTPHLVATTNIEGLAPVEEGRTSLDAADGEGAPVSVDGDGGNLSFTLGGDEGTALFCAALVNWTTGDTLMLNADLSSASVDLAQIPLLQVRYATVPTFRKYFASGPYGDPLVEFAKILAIVFGALALIYTLFGIGLISSVTRAVNALHKGTKRVAAGELDHRIRVRSKDQLGALATSFNEMTGSVQELLHVQAERDRLESELQIAAEVQRTMLPAEFPSIPGLAGAASSVMAREVGGDLYDFIRIGTHRIAVVVGDVSGKGVSAALVMSNVVSSIRSLLARGDSNGPADVLRHLNGVLCETTAPEVFVTLFYAEYDMKKGNVVYANAGHDWPIVMRTDGSMEELKSGSLFLGSLPDVDVVECELELEPGDVLLAYTDGLVDTEDEHEEPYQRERVLAVARDAARDPRALVSALQRSVERWRGDAPEVDDITVVALERRAVTT